MFALLPTGLGGCGPAWRRQARQDPPQHAGDACGAHRRHRVVDFVVVQEWYAQVGVSGAGVWVGVVPA